MQLLHASIMGGKLNRSSYTSYCMYYCEPLVTQQNTNTESSITQQAQSGPNEEDSQLKRRAKELVQRRTEELAV